MWSPAAPPSDKSMRLSGFLAAEVEALTAAGAVSRLLMNTTVDTTSGAAAFTLADGVSGQIKNIVMVADGGDGTLTPSNFGNGTTITFNDVGDSCQLLFAGSSWWIVSNNGCTVA